MSEEEKKAIDDLFSLTHINGYINLYDQNKANIYTSDLKRWQNGVKVLLNLANNQQIEIRQYEKTLHDQIIKDYDMESKLKSELEKKDKIINKMSEQLTSPIHSKEWVIEYYTKEVEGK